MDQKRFRKLWIFLGIFLGVWLILRYVFPIILPFLLGWALAAMAEPGVNFLQRRLRFRRGIASAVVVSGGIVLLLGLLGLVLALCYREAVAWLAGMPDVMEGVLGYVQNLRDWALSLTTRAPAGLSAFLTQAIQELFASGSVLIGRATQWLLDFAGRLMEGLPGKALTLGTAVVAAYLISAQYPALRQRLRDMGGWQRLRAGIKRVRPAAASWIRAQLRLSGVTLCIVLAGLFFMGVEYAILWALVTAVVDAVPMLGTGIILIPWSILLFLQGQWISGAGMLGLWALCMVIRSMLEPKLVGKHLGINPLLTLIALYAGFRLWGVGGMILAPILAVMAKELSAMRD